MAVTFEIPAEVQSWYSNKNKAGCVELTSDLVSVICWWDIVVIDAAVHADSLPEVVDLVEAELAVQMEEYDAVPYRQVWMCFQVPNVNQVFIVQQRQCIPAISNHRGLTHLNSKHNSKINKLHGTASRLLVTPWSYVMRNEDKYQKSVQKNLDIVLEHHNSLIVLITSGGDILKSAIFSNFRPPWTWPWTWIGSYEIPSCSIKGLIVKKCWLVVKKRTCFHTIVLHRWLTDSSGIAVIAVRRIVRSWRSQWPLQ